MSEANKGLNVFDVENVAEELDETANLLGLLDEELEDLTELTMRVENAKTKQEEQEAKSLLIIQVENRLKYLDTLQRTASDKVIEQKEALDAMTSATARSFNDDKEDANHETR